MAKLTLAVPAANGQGAAQTWRGGWEDGERGTTDSAVTAVSRVAGGP